MEENGIISVIIFIVIGIAVMLGLLGTFTNENQNPSANISEQFQANGNGTIFVLAHQKIVPGSVNYINSSSGKAQVETINFSVNYKAGQIVNFINGTQTWNVSYRYYPAEYVENTNVRLIYSVLGVLGAVFIIFGIYRKLNGGSDE